MKNKILKILKNDNRLWVDNEFNQTKLIDLVEKYDEIVIDNLFNNADIKQKFFIKIKQAWVFKMRDFVFFMEENKVNNSFTDYKNRIGLSDGKHFLKDTQDVILDFPFKDCILEGGQSTDEGLDGFYEFDESVSAKDEKLGAKPNQYNLKKSKRKEVFFNQVLAKDEIDRLTDVKALVNWKRYDKKGASKVTDIKRDKDGNITDNLIIKGNNLLALHTLKSNFAGKVKLIYIDPPYNTGNDSFNYNDNFNHSTWLTFMKNRLEVARELLSDDGVIFVQCDDNEQAYLKVLMDEVFNRDNFVSNLVWENKEGGGKSDSKHFRVKHEYVLIFGKNKIHTTINGLEVENVERYKLSDEFEGERGKHYLQKLGMGTIQYSKSLDYKIIAPDKSNIEPKDNNNGRKACWRWGKDKLKWGLKNNFVVIKKDSKNVWTVYTKQYLNCDHLGNIGTRKIQPIGVISKHSTTQSSKHLKELFGDSIFNYSKPEGYLQHLVEISTKKDDIVLDYHLGSGTTCAVAHKMGRQYIGIEQMDYIEDIAVKRMQKVIGEKVKKDGELLEAVDFDTGGISKSVDWQGGGEFVYMELAKWNEAAKEKILKCKDLKSLIKLFDELYNQYFLNYNLKIKEFKEKVIKEDNFKNLDSTKQKEMFLTMLDLNQMYVNESEMADSKYGLSKKDQQLTKEFYHGK